MSYQVEVPITPEMLKRRAVSGTVVLALRRILLQIIQTASTVILARILFPKTFGQFSILTFAVEFLALLVSQGFVSALIQAKGGLKEKDVSTVFWFVVCLSVLPFVVVWFGAGLFATFWGNELTVGAYHLLAPAVFLVNLKLVLSSILERQIKYIRIAIVDISESVTYAVVSVILAILGWGLEALIFGYMCGKAVGLILLFLIGDYKPKLVFYDSFIKKMAGFALNFQSYSIVNSISSAIAPIYVGRVVGVTGTGYLAWAGGIGLVPWAFGELVGKVTFPVFSRIQGKEKLLARSFERALELNLMVVMPLSVIIFVFAEPITNIIFTYKWLPAVWALRYFVLLGAITAVNVIAQSALLALGEVKFVRNVSLLSAFCFWVLAIFLIPKIGFSGHPLAWFLGSCVQLALVFRIKKIIKVAYFPKVFTYFGFSLASTLLIFLVSGKIEHLPKLILVLLAAFGSYLSIVLIFRREQLFYYLKNLKP